MTKSITPMFWSSQSSEAVGIYVNWQRYSLPAFSATFGSLCRSLTLRIARSNSALLNRLVSCVEDFDEGMARLSSSLGNIRLILGSKVRYVGTRWDLT